MRREDHYTSTERDAAWFEWVAGADERVDYDDRPTRREIEADEHDNTWESNGGW